jgi:hypothetical protein
MVKNFGSIQTNGYTSTTWNQLNLGIKQTKEWLGEDILTFEEDDERFYPYSAIAKTKTICYYIN